MPPSAAVARFLGPAAAAVLAESGRLARAASGEWRRPDPDDVAACLESGRARRDVSRSRLLPFDLLLAGGAGALRLFHAGPFDELRFFQRVVTGPRHDLEWLLRLEPRDAGSESFAPFGVVRLGPASGRPLPDLRGRGLERVAQAYGFAALPTARSITGGRTTAFDPARGIEAEGRNQLRPAPAQATMLDALRRGLDGPDLVAWLETAFADRTEGPVLHRYYLSSDLRAFVVRDDPATGRRLHEAETSAAVTRRLLVYVERRAA